MALRLPILSSALLLAVSTTALADVVTYDSDAAFLATGFVKAFGAQSRWGNNALDGDWELGIVDEGSTPIPPAQANFQWSALPGYGTADPNHSYSFGFDPGSTPNATYEVLGASPVLLSATVPGQAGSPPAPINTLALRAAANGGQVARLGSVTVYFDIAGAGPVTLGPVVGDDSAEYVVLVDNRLAGGFWLAGDATLQDGTSQGSRPMYEFKVGVTPVPLPAAGWLLLSGVAGLGVLARRRRTAPAPAQR